MNAITRVFFGVVVTMVLAKGAEANDYAKCMLDNAPAIQNATNNALDVIILSCIKLHEEPIDDLEIAKIKLQFVGYGDMRSLSGVGMIAQLYNGSPYDITAISIALIDKKTKEQREYRYDQFIQYNRGPGIVTALPAPQYRRFIKSLTFGEYVFPLAFAGVPQEEFFKRYDVAHFSARGVR